MRDDRTPAASGGAPRGWIGSDEHKQAFCRSFVETHRPFRPAEIVWPELDPEGLLRLSGLPIWNEAVRTEAETALKVQTLGRVELDPILAEAIALQGYEEGRHAEILKLLTAQYGIAVAPFEAPRPPRNAIWEFVRSSDIPSPPALILRPLPLIFVAGKPSRIARRRRGEGAAAAVKRDLGVLR